MEGTIVPLQFIADGSGWVGTIGLLLFNSFSTEYGDVSSTFEAVCAVVAGFLCVSFGLMMVYFCSELHQPANGARELQPLVDEGSASESGDEEGAAAHPITLGQ